jgi:hypothetical protein
LVAWGEPFAVPSTDDCVIANVSTACATASECSASPLVVDVGQVVAQLVVAAVERLARRPAVERHLAGLLDVLRAGEAPARRDPGRRERVVVRTPVEGDRLGGQPRSTSSRPVA